MDYPLCFQGLFTNCPKCGASGVLDTRIDYCPGCLLARYGEKPREHMHRTCNICGYVWLEKTLEEYTPEEKREQRQLFYIPQEEPDAGKVPGYQA